MPSRCKIICKILIAILLPPLGVYLCHGCCTAEVWICVLLTLLGYIPGIIYALYAIVFVLDPPATSYYISLYTHSLLPNY